MSDSDRPYLRRQVSLVLLSLVATVAISLAVYLWIGSLRAERALRAASLQGLRNATRRDPNNPQPFYYLGLRLLQLGQPGPAAPAFRHAADLDSDDEKSWIGAAIAAAAHGDLQEGLGIAILYSRRHPDNANAYLTLAQLRSQQGAAQHAYQEAMTAARLDPRDSDAWRLAGEQATLMGQLPEAEQALRKAIAQNPSDWRSRIDLGKLLTRRGRLAEGSACFETASRLAPGEALPPLLLGRQLLSQAVTPAQVEEARRVLRSSAEIQANNAEVNHQLGRCEMRLAHWAAARDYLMRARGLALVDIAITTDLIAVDRQMNDPVALQEATGRQRQLLAYQDSRRRLMDRVRSHPGDPRPLLDLARLCARSGDTIPADQCYRLILAREPDLKIARQEWEGLRGQEAGQSPLPVASPEPTVLSSDETPIPILLRDADAFLAQGHNDQARSAYLSILARDARVAAACEGLARLKDAEGDREQAVAYLERAASLDPQLWRAQLGLGSHYGERGAYKEAARHYRLGLAIVPRNAEGWHSFGLTLANDPDSYLEGEEALDRAVALNPANAVFLRDLADLQARRHELDTAESSFRRALALAPGDPATQRALGAFLIDNRSAAASLREAARLLQAAATSEPDNPMLAYWRGRLALQQQDVRQAISLLLHAAPDVRRANGVRLWYSLSRAYRVAGDQKRSAAALAMAEKTRTLDQRITTIEDRLSNDPRNAALNLQLARLDVEAGEIAAAIEQYRRTDRIDPGNGTARAELAKLVALVDKRWHHNDQP